MTLRFVVFYCLIFPCVDGDIEVYQTLTCRPPVLKKKGTGLSTDAAESITMTLGVLDLCAAVQRIIYSSNYNMGDLKDQK